MYQERANYYNSLTMENQYLNVYKCIRNLFNNYKTHGMDSLCDLFPNEKITLISIRSMEGLGRSWGHVRRLLELLDDTTIDRNIIEYRLKEIFSSILTTMLEVLPAYIQYVPQAKMAFNQPIVDFLHNRGNEYRITGNPKFYAYDRVVSNILVSDFKVTSANCIYLKGVGPRISHHIREFLNVENSPEMVEENHVENSLEMVEENHVENSLEMVEENHVENSIEMVEENNVENSPEMVEENHVENSLEMVEENHVENSLVEENHVDTIFNSQELPNVYRVQNYPVAQYLWEKAHEFIADGFRAKSWAWLKACQTVCNSEYYMYEYLENLEQFPYIGEIMADVIREFYANIPAKVYMYCPEIRPISRVRGNKFRHYHQKLIDFLWRNNYHETAYEIYCMDRIPQIRTDFKRMNTASQNVINSIFAQWGNIPVADNWINQDLTNWLWRAGNNCPSKYAVNYYNASRAVARKKNIVNYEDLLSIKYIGPYIAERVGAEFYGKINPQNYIDMKRELMELRSNKNL
jgi:hypothetical protein